MTLSSNLSKTSCYNKGNMLYCGKRCVALPIVLFFGFFEVMLVQDHFLTCSPFFPCQIPQYESRWMEEESQ